MKDGKLERGDILYCFDPMLTTKVQFTTVQMAVCQSVHLRIKVFQDRNGNFYARAFHKQDPKRFHKYYVATPELVSKWSLQKSGQRTYKLFKQLSLSLSLEEMKKVVSFIQNLRKENEART